MYLGTYKIDDLLVFTANTHTAATGAATDADGSVSYRIFEDETTTPILTGTMALLDGSNTAGFYSEQVTLSAANGFEVGKCYTAYISAAVAGVTGTTARQFQVEVAPATATALATAQAGIDDVPTVAELNARTLVAASYFDPATDAVTLAAATHTGAVIPTVTDVTTKTGYSLSATGVQAIWDALTSALTAVGSIGKLLVDRIDAAITSRMATFAYTAPLDATATEAAAAAALAAYDAATAADVSGISVPTVGAIADQVWDEALAGHLTAGTTGAALNDAGVAADPWGTALPGAYGAGTAGQLLGDLDVSSLAEDMWSYSPRTLTTAAATITNVTSGEALVTYRGDTMSISFTGLGSVAARTKLWFTAKMLSVQPDTDALIQIIEAVGLVVVMGEAAATAGNGALTVTNAATGAMTVTLHAAEAAKMPVERRLVYDIQMLSTAGVETLTAGTLTFTADVTRATS